MKIHVAISSLPGRALEKVLETFGQSLHSDVAMADVVVVWGKQELERLHNPHQRFIVTSDRDVGRLPDNAVWISVLTIVPEILARLAAWQEDMIDGAPGVPEISAPVQFELGREHSPSGKGRPNDVLHVLVVDDTPANLQRALEVLRGDCYVTLAQSIGQAKRLIAEIRYDAVLSDCRMPIRTDDFNALSSDVIEIGATEACGPFLMFQATKRGARFAVVTDGNHHRDWASAMFDDLREPQIVNGQPVLLINYMGKAWDQALKKLMSL